jgi:hypothetical protein
MYEHPSLSALCLATIARNASRALFRAHTVPLDERCVEQLLRALKADPHALTDELLLVLLRPGLDALELAGCVQVTDAGLRRAAARLARLRRLDLSELGVSDDALGALLAVPARLEALTLTRCRRLTDGAVRALARRTLGALVELNLNACKHLTSDGVATALAHARSLRHLDLGNLPQLGDSFFAPGLPAHGAALGGLQSLRLGGCRQLTDAGLAAALAATCALRTADLSGTAAAALAADALGSACGGTLYTLHLSSCAALDTEALAIVLVGCLHLRTLVLSRCARVSALAFHHSSHSLRTLDVSFCPLGHAELVDVAANCPELVGLSVRGCAGVEDETLLELATVCTELEAVDVGHCPALSDGALRALGASCRNLTELQIDGSAQIGDEAVAAMVEACPLLALVSLAHCPRLRGPALYALARHSHFLRELDVSFCDALNEGALVHLARHCAQLEAVRASGCGWLGPAGLEQVVRSCARLRRLDVARCPLLGLEAVTRIARLSRLVVAVEMGL